MSAIRSFFARLFTWPFFVGLGTGIALVIGGLSLLSFFVVQQLQSRSTGPKNAPVSAPQIPEHAARSAYGTVPDDWSLHPLSGDADSTSFAALTGPTTVVNLWATWCTPCIAELPTLDSLHATTGDSVRVVLVSQEKPGTVRRFIADKDYDLPFYTTSDLPSVFDGRALPRTFVLDRKRRIRYRQIGAANWNAAPVHRLLRQVSSASPRPSS